MNKYPNKLTFRVTSGNIFRGRVKSKCFCPMANALKNQFKLGDFSVSVSEKDIVIVDSYNNLKISYDHTNVSSSFVKKFDADRRSVKPKTFVIVKKNETPLKTVV